MISHHYWTWITLADPGPHDWLQALDSSCRRYVTAASRRSGATDRSPWWSDRRESAFSCPLQVPTLHPRQILVSSVFGLQRQASGKTDPPWLVDHRRKYLVLTSAAKARLDTMGVRYCIRRTLSLDDQGLESSFCDTVFDAWTPNQRRNNTGAFKSGWA